MQNDFLFLCLGFKFLIIFTVLFGQNLSLFARGGVKKDFRTCLLHPTPALFSDLCERIGQVALNYMAGMVKVLFV